MTNTAATPIAVLIVADHPDHPQGLQALMRERTRAHPCRFTLLVPAVAHGLHRVVDPEDQCCAEAQQTIDILVPILEATTNRAIKTIIGAHEPLAAIQDALNDQNFDEVILGTRPSRWARWAHLDLRRKVADLDQHVSVFSTVTAGSPQSRHRHPRLATIVRDPAL